jgi:hypothetical protein
MELATTRTAICHTLSALAAVALVSAFAIGPASAGGLQNTERELVDSLQTMHRGSVGLLDKPTFGEKFKTAPAAQQGPQQRTHYQFRWWYD